MWQTENRATLHLRIIAYPRYRLVRSLFKEIGFDGDELEMRARTFFVFNSFDPGVTIQESRQQQKARLKLRHKFFVQR